MIVDLSEIALLITAMSALLLANLEDIPGSSRASAGIPIERSLIRTL